MAGPLKVRRLRTMAIEVYKILHKESPSYLHDLIKIIDTKYCFRYDSIAEIPSVRTTRYGLKHRNLFHSKNICPLLFLKIYVPSSSLLKEEERAYIF
jgi:hypothetical protein